MPDTEPGVNDHKRIDWDKLSHCQQMDQMKFWLIQAELTLEQVSTCPHCKNCRQLASQYLELVANYPG
jgi:hypothetical protein